MAMLLDAKTCAAAAGSGGIGIVYGKCLSDQIVGKVDFRPGQKIQRYRVNKDFGAILLNDQVFLNLGIVERKIILKAGTSPAGHRQP